jgi:amino acid adenylation domain-containing protein
MSDFTETTSEKHFINWKQHLSSLSPIDLPTDYLRTGVHETQMARVEAWLSPELTQQINLFSRQRGNYYSALVAAFQALLNRYSNQTNLDFGCLLNNQLKNQKDSLTNLLILSTTFVAGQNFIEAVEQVESRITEGLTDQQFPFNWALEQLAARQVEAEPPVFNVRFSLQQTEPHSGNLCQPDRIGQSGIELSFELIWGNDAELLLRIRYRQSLFSQTTIIRMIAHYGQLLQAALNQPDTPIRRLNWLSETDRHLLLEAFQAAPQNLPTDQTVLTLLDQQIRQQPNRLALVWEGGKLTYHELDVRSRQLAFYLLNLGIRVGQFVPVVLDRSAELVISLLAILRTGAVYVPLDENWPDDRIDFVRTDCDAKLLLSRQKLADRFASSTIPVLYVDEWLADPTTTQETVLPPVNQQDLIYTIYTSGSTGEPKGVLVEHGSLFNFIHWYAQAYPVIVNGRAPLATGVAFDVSASEIWCNLAWGTTLYVIPEETRLHPRRLLDYYADHQITHAIVPNALVYELVGLPQPAGLKLSYLITGGEQLKPVDVSTLPYQLVNHYGPSENTICTTEYVLQPQDLHQLPPIGKPIAGTTVYVLDEFGQLLPIGIPGELYLGGRQVARGYLNRPEQTAERFLPNPFEPGQRFYRTGDQVRWRSDGNLEFLNRVDHQVKIRGYRIELGEIESVLKQYNGVKQAIVVVENTGIDKRLIGYIVTDFQLDLMEIKSFLHQKLPEYMVPWLLIELDEMPLTSNGKVDKNRLPKRGQNSVLKDAFTGPRTQEEHLLASLWMSVLKLKKIDVNANFFELGGSSLTAIQTISRLEKQTGKRLPVTALFEHPTVEGLGLVLQQSSKFINWDTIVPIKTGGAKKPLYVLSSTFLNADLFKILATRMDQDQPIYRLQAKGIDGIEEPLDTIEAIANRYAAAIIEHNPDGQYALAGYSFDGLLAFETANQLNRLGKKTDTLIMFDSYAYQSDYFDPWLQKTVNKIRLFLKKMGHIFEVLKNEPELIIEEKRNSIKRRINNLYQQIRHGQNEEYDGIAETIRKMEEKNRQAWLQYRLAPQEIAIELFRVKKRSAYLEDFEYLGWKPFALKGINVHEIPGDHHNLFASPYDKELAGILQHVLKTD